MIIFLCDLNAAIGEEAIGHRGRRRVVEFLLDPKEANIVYLLPQNSRHAHHA